MIVLCSLNRKGGTGKTTFSVNTASIFASPEIFSKRVLFIDLDSQGNGTSTLQASFKNKPGIYDVLCKGFNIEEAIIHSPFDNIDVLQGTLNLDEADEELHDTQSREFLLKRQLELIKDKYDYVFIDCPPSKNILTINALTASDYVVIPMEAGKYALDGINIMTTFINQVKTKYNSSLKIAGIAIIKKEKNTSQDGYASLIKTAFPIHVFNQVIRKSTIAEQSISTNKPLYYYYKSAPITQDFVQIAKELYYIVEDGKNEK